MSVKMRNIRFHLGFYLICPSIRTMPANIIGTQYNRTIVRIYATIEPATWAVPSESLQGVRRVPMAKFTALLLAASVLVLSIALLYLAVF